jgi:hypothetical protein
MTDCTRGDVLPNHEAGVRPTYGTRSEISPERNAKRGSVSIDKTVQHEINSFLIESFGRLIKPSMLEELRKRLDPSFTEEQLDHKLERMFPSQASPISLAMLDSSHHLDESAPREATSKEWSAAEMEYTEEKSKPMICDSPETTEDSQPVMSVKEQPCSDLSSSPLIVEDMRNGRASHRQLATDGDLDLTLDDVVVFCDIGDSRMIELAGRWVAQGRRMVFLGNTALDPNMNYAAFMSAGARTEKALAEMIESAWPELDPTDARRKLKRGVEALNVIRAVEGFRSQGVEASYYRCDSSDPEMADRVVSQILRRYGRVDVVVHDGKCTPATLFQRKMDSSGAASREESRTDCCLPDASRSSSRYSLGWLSSLVRYLRSLFWR